MLRIVEFSIGIVIWVAVLWDGFATVVLPRTVDPMRRLSGRFNTWSWWVWSRLGRRIGRLEVQLSFLSIYGPISVMMLLILWAGLVIFAFGLIYQGLGSRFQATAGVLDFGTLLYMSGSTFLTLGLGDVTSADPFGRLFMIAEAATGFVFLGLIITYMPLLDQAYSAREVGNLLVHSRAGHPPSALKLLHRYYTLNNSEIVRSNLREAERWMAEILQSHLSHPVLAFYRAQHWGQYWLVSLTVLLDCCALQIAGGDGLPAAQARLTYRMGLRLLKDLTSALAVPVDPHGPSRLTPDDFPALCQVASKTSIGLHLEPAALNELVRLVQRYDADLHALAGWLVVALPPVFAHDEPAEPDEAWDRSEFWFG